MTPIRYALISFIPPIVHTQTKHRQSTLSCAKACPHSIIVRFDQNSTAKHELKQNMNEKKLFQLGLVKSMVRICLLSLVLALPAKAQQANETLQQKVERLTRELDEAKRQLAESETELAETEVPVADSGPTKITPGDLIPALEGLKIGGAVRVNYYFGDYNDNSPETGADAAGYGTIALDTFRINMDYERGPWIGKFEYRFYPGYQVNDSYNFLHTGWLGYNFDSGSQVQVGVNRVPFGPGPYGVSQSWFFDQHYYLGLADDMDLGVKYSTSTGNLSVDLAYYYSDEGTWSGSTVDSSRYSYDVVNESGTGYEERNQFNLRTIYAAELGDVSMDLGASAQYGMLRSRGAQDDGDHYALSLHPVFKWDNWTLAPQLTYYEYDIDGYLADDPNGDLIQFGAYDFPTTVATEAWVAAASLSYQYEVNQVGWLDYIIPFVEYSSIMKKTPNFNDSNLFILGAAWARGGWYIYTEAAFSNGNDFIGDIGGFNSRFGSNPDNDWLARYNINVGYYY